MMAAIHEQDWDFADIERTCKDRAMRLETASSADNLVEALTNALHVAIDQKDALRISVDSKQNAFLECRAIVQFRVCRDLYDWFFNGRTGYRSRFWFSAETGIAFNGQIIARLRNALEDRLPATIAARRIVVLTKDGSRMEENGGAAAIQRDAMVKSLIPAKSKIWICERLCPKDGGAVTDIGFAVLSDAERNLPKLRIPVFIRRRPRGT